MPADGWGTAGRTCHTAAENLQGSVLTFAGPGRSVLASFNTELLDVIQHVTHRRDGPRSALLIHQRNVPETIVGHQEQRVFDRLIGPQCRRVWRHES